MPGSSLESNIAAAVASIGTAPARAPSPVEVEVLQLFDSMRERLLRYLVSFSLTAPDCEEIVQETFLALFQHLQRGRSGHNLHGWLFRVAHNLALRRRRDDRRDLQSLSSAIVTSEMLVRDPGLNPEDQFAAGQTRQRLMAVVSVLPEQDRRCLFLRAEGLRYREIADVLDMSLSSVSASLCRSLARIGRAAER